MNWNIFSPIATEIGGFFRDRQKLKAKKAERKDELLVAKHTSQVESVKRKDELIAAKHAAKVAKAKQRVVAVTDYDNLVVAESRNTIVDEVLIGWTLLIITCLFIPPLALYAQAGFTALGAAPTWFQLCVIGIYIRTLGLRFLFSGRNILGKIVK